MQYREYNDLIQPKATNVLFSLFLVILLWSGLFDSENQLLPLEGLVLGDSPFSHNLSQSFDFFSKTSIYISVLLLILIAFTMEWINDAFSFITIRTLLPAFFFIIIASLMIRPHSFSVSFLIILIESLIIFLCFQLCEGTTYNIQMTFFNIGLLVGLSICFSLSLISSIFVLIIYFYQIRLLSIRTCLAFIMGFVVPLFYATLYFVLTDNLFYWEAYLTSWTIVGGSLLMSTMSDSALAYCGLVTLLGVFSLVIVLILRERQSPQCRYETNFIAYNFILTLSLIVAGPSDWGVLLPLYFYFLSFLMGHAFSSDFSLPIKIGWILFTVSSVLFLLYPLYQFSV